MEGGDWAGKEMEVMGGVQNQVWGGTREMAKWAWKRMEICN